jgi:hypothetical protein
MTNTIIPWDQAYPVGSRIRILERARNHPSYDTWNQRVKDLIGTEQIIVGYFFGPEGVEYLTNVSPSFSPIFAHRCVQPFTQLTKQEIADKFGLDINQITILK